MVRIRGAARWPVLLVPVVVMLSLVGPVQAEAPADAPTETRAEAPADFAQEVRKAVSSTVSGYVLREKASHAPASELDRSQRVRADIAIFSSGGRVLTVLRTVGAEREVTQQYAPTGRVEGTVSVRRPGAGVRTATVTTTADRWGPGLTILAWTERSGVNYQLVARDGLGRVELVGLARALPKDSSKATAGARTTIAKAKPPAPSRIDERMKQPQTPTRGGVSTQGTGNEIVDGVGVLNDDLGNEAMLCNGCKYWNGNYSGMWQHILYADGKLAWSQVDCQFGSTTASATVSWQRSKGLAGDGFVGPDTRGKADNYLFKGGGVQVFYNGTHRAMYFSRWADGLYEFESPEVRIYYDRWRSPPGC